MNRKSRLLVQVKIINPKKTLTEPKTLLGLRWAMTGIYLAVFIFCSSLIYSQSALNILDFYNESFQGEKARIITTNAHIGDYTFHTNVGGISFQAIASPADNLNREDISLDFVDNRLVIKIGMKIFYPDLPFWQLAPIVNFTNSPYTVAISLLGDTVGNLGAKCRFHPAFLDNLLGLRLFQADLLNLTNIMWDIPIDDQQNHILAPYEQPFVPFRDSSLHQTIFEKLTKNIEFTSFVLTDKDADIIFEMDESGLKFSGQPYYYFTNTVLDMEKIRHLRTELIDCYNDIETHAKLLLKEEYSPALNPRNHLGDLRKALNKNKQDGIVNPYSSHYIESAINKLDSLNNLTDAEIGIQFHVLDDYSESFKPYWNLLKKYNQPVYSAVENTALWSAFFRYVRKINPNNWSLFVKKVEKGKWDAPTVKTPTFFEINYFRYFDEKEKNK